MDFKRFFNIKRTKMVDEAAFNHTPMPIIKTVGIFVLVFIIAQLFTSFLVSIPTVIYLFASGDVLEISNAYISGLISEDEYVNSMALLTENLPIWLTLVSLFLYVGIIVVAVYYCVKKEKRTLASMGIRRGNIALEYLFGALIGAIMLSLSLLIPYLCGLVSFEVNPEGFSLVLVLFFLAFVVQGASEEILVRGYFMVSLARDTKVSVAVAISSCAFALLHLGNAGLSPIALINIALMGAFLGIYVFKRGNLWGACAIHTAWNFVQGNIFGIKVSGMGNLPSLLKMVSKSDLTLLTGGEFGIEGSLCSTLVILIFIVLVLLVPQNKNETSEVEVEYFA